MYINCDIRVGGKGKMLEVTLQTMTNSSEFFINYYIVKK